jgi:hypothetical protein
MRARRWMTFALFGNVVVAGTTYLHIGWSSVDAHAAARNTVRFALIFFLLGFSQPGLVRWFSSRQLRQAWSRRLLQHSVFTSSQSSL